MMDDTQKSVDKTTFASSYNKQDVQEFTKQTLQGRIFIGHFQEKRYVASLQSYRDVVIISKDEMELIRDLKIVKERIEEFYSEGYWVGITNPNTVCTPYGHCVWVELHEEIFGSYWYQIKRVKFKENEIQLRLKSIRPVETDTSAQSTSEVSFSTETFINCCKEKLDVLFATVITLENTKNAIVFFSVLLATLVSGSFCVIQFVCDFLIRFMKEASNIIHVLTPSIIAFINLIAKIIGGFYLLILSMWQTKTTPTYQSPYEFRRMDIGNDLRFRRALPPPRQSTGVSITPLD